MLDVENLRNDETEGITVEDEEGKFMVSVYLDNRELSQMTALLSLLRTLFVCMVLTLAAIYFAKDANDLALGPIERMIQKVNTLAKNPLALKE